MERSAIYRRALAPLMGMLGVMGVAGAGGGAAIGLHTPGAFAAYWMAISVVAILGALLLVRRQALKDSELFWSLPTRRVAQALLPPLFAGLAAGLFFFFAELKSPFPAWTLAAAWMILYGCALHSAGFFMARGIKLFGWGFIIGGCALALAPLCPATQPPVAWANIAMGVSFGGAHLAYSLYLYFTEGKTTS